MTGARLRWAEIDLGALAHNVAAVRSRLSEGTELMAVVKANAYGHGAVEVARAALAAGAGWLGVATVEEAAELRAAALDAPLLVMGPVPPGSESSLRGLEARLNVFSREQVDRLAEVGDPAHPTRLHLKVDTGMARLGCTPAEALPLARLVAADPRLELEGLWTHFAEADDPASPRTPRQLEEFLRLAADLRAAGLDLPVLHVANSAGALGFPPSQLTLARCGLPLYGYPSSAASQSLDLRPVLTWKARVVALHDLDPGDRVGYGGTYVAPGRRRTATISTGYADGYPRALSNRGEVLVGGRKAPLVGRVSMDYITADVSDVPGVAVGDEVVLLGAQGAERVSAEDLARQLGTISWEVLTMPGPRVERVFLRA